jgi:hypothetical protein
MIENGGQMPARSATHPSIDERRAQRMPFLGTPMIMEVLRPSVETTPGTMASFSSGAKDSVVTVAHLDPVGAVGGRDAAALLAADVSPRRDLG